MLLWFVATSVLTIHYVFTDPRFDHRPLVVGALLQVGGHPSKLGQDVIEQIRALDDEYRGERYRLSPWLRRRAHRA